MSVGDTADTAEFAANTIRRWWHQMGQHRFGDATRLLITADAGGSNGYRIRAWKTHLAALATETGLTITVCHYPPGTSKWNKIEHRMFSFITLNWRGRPLTSIRTIVELIAATTTKTGLTIQADHDPTEYPKGVKISDARTRRHPPHPTRLARRLELHHPPHMKRQIKFAAGPKYLLYGLGNLLSNQEPSCCGEVSQEGALMLVRLEPADAGWSATEVRYVPTWVDRHRDHVILPTLSWDISEHRHAAWLERSLERVGRSLDLNDAGMSVSQACAWMMVDCSSAPGGADTKSGTTSAEQRPGSKALSARSRAFRGRKQRRRIVEPPLSAAPTRSRGWCRRCMKEVDGPCSWLLERLQPSSSPG